MENLENHTLLDQARLSLHESDQADWAMNEYYRTFADTVFRILLSGEDEKTARPAVFDTSDGQFILGFDTDEKFADFCQTPRLFSSMTGEEIAASLSGSETGIAVNINDEDLSYFLTPSHIGWLIDMISQQTEIRVSSPVALIEPKASDATTLKLLTQRFAVLRGCVEAAYLCGALSDSGEMTDTILLIDCQSDAQTMAIRVAASVTKFTPNAAGIAVTFAEKNSVLALEATKHGIPISIPKMPTAEKSAPTAPGMDPSKPPILR